MQVINNVTTNVNYLHVLLANEVLAELKEYARAEKKPSDSDAVELYLEASNITSLRDPL